MSNPAQTSNPPPIAAAYGKEAFLVRQAVRDWATEWLGPDADPTALTDVDGAGAELSSVLDEVRTLPFFGRHRVVVISGADLFITKHREALERFTESPCSTGTLILECKSLPATTKLHKRIAEVGRVMRFDPPKAHTINQWITQRCQKKYECRMDVRAAARLRELVGDHLGVLDSELAKLSVYVGESRRIGVKEVGELSAAHREETVFGIIEAMLSGDVSRAMTLWNQVWSTDRAAPARAIGGLAWAVRRVVNAKVELEGGASLQQVAKQLWTDPQRVRAQVANRSVGELEAILGELRDADARAKSIGRRDAVRDAIEGLIVRIACGRNGGLREQTA